MGAPDASSSDSSVDARARIDAGPDRVDASIPPPPPVGASPVGASSALIVDGQTYVSDPHRDTLWVFDHRAAELRDRVEFAPGSEPGRMAASGRTLAVVLRDGSLAWVSTNSLSVTRVDNVCTAPRGVDLDDDGVAHVACAGGELVRVTSDGVQDRRFVARDLRDVVVDGDRIFVSILRRADVFLLEGDELTRVELPDSPEIGDANTAWQMKRAEEGGVTLLHQRSMQTPILVEERMAYGNGVRCRFGGVVETAISHIDRAGTVTTGPSLQTAALGVDFAIFQEGDIVLANAGMSPMVRTGSIALYADVRETECTDADGLFIPAEPVSAIATDRTDVLGWRPRSAELVVWDPGADPTVIPTGAAPMTNEGQRIFHEATPSFLACASCHPEGREDGVTWNFSTGSRRTQSLVIGDLGSTAPFHWNGDHESMERIMVGSFVERMGAELPPADAIAATTEWLSSLPIVRAHVQDESAAARGEALFDERCTGCHSGAHGTNNESVDVGTGGVFQVPPLPGVSIREPYFHNGCAESLDAVLDGCGAPHPGSESLSSAERSDLLSYLGTL